MNFTVEAAAFRAALKTAGRVIPQKSPWPILSNLKVITNDSRVTLIGSNGDLTFEADIPAQVETEGVAIMPHGPLSAFASAAKADTITLKLEGEAVKVSAGRSRIALSAADAADYPNYRPADGEPVQMDADTLTRALRFCATACSTDETRYYLQGVNMTTREGVVEAHGTDGYGLHVAQLPDAPIIGDGAILPRDAVALICDAAEGKDAVSLAVSARGWMFAVAGLRMWGKVIDGSFPDVWRVIEGFGQADPFAVTAEDDLATTLKVAACGADEIRKKGRGLVFIADPGKPIVIRGGKTVSGVTAAGRAETQAEAIGTARFMLSSDLLSRALPALKGDIALSSLAEGARIEPAQQDAHLHLSAVLMGIRAADEELQDV
ncbi:DNA polymerase III subunit beta [Sagittula sp. S175]|uniref:DNA polymerase III subunit beta n=1 Tax=Sagittula sp. S175 TaxID=3415129 RepID=UPI003C79BFCC